MKNKAERSKKRTPNLALMGAVVDKLIDGREELMAIVRSGQYFTVLATRLDKLSSEIKGPHETLYKNQLQALTDELLFIQQNYKIKRRRKS